MALPTLRRTSARGLGAVAAVGVLAVALAACSSGPTVMGGGSAHGASASPSVTHARLAIAATVPFSAPARFRVAGARLVSAEVTGHSHGTALPGHVEADGSTWVSDGLPVPGARYDIRAVVKHGDQAQTTLNGTFHVSTVPASQTLSYWVTPGIGWTVGVNAPIVIRFDHRVSDEATVERALTVYSGVPVVGAWHWVNPYEVHFRPEKAWPAHMRIRVKVALDGVRAGPKMWGTGDLTLDFATGDAHLTKVSGETHELSLYVNHKLYATWPTSLGRPEFATRTGNYVVLSKDPTLHMTSCSAQITCDKSNPNWYDLPVDWDVRLTYSGTFIHSAPWSVAHQGVDNVSHGCINLSPAHATTYYGIARYGDLVTVSGTIRGPDDLVRSGDPGMADWNLPWSTYVAGSALGVETTTLPLA